MHHVDLYRLQPGEDLTGLGLFELFAGPGITAVEWAERLPDAARPQPRWEVHLAHAGDDRRQIAVSRVA